MTVPNVFINGEHIGGNDAVVSAFKESKIQKKLEEAKVSFSFEQSDEMMKLLGMKAPKKESGA